MDGNSKTLFHELIKKQRLTCKNNRKVSLYDIKRISKNINSSIFDASNCCLWKGYITNKNNINKSKYINFYFRHSKVALHRLLYENYVGNLENNQYIKYSCTNKGFCCNVNHMYILNVNKKEVHTSVESKKNIKKKLIVKFD